MERYVVWLFRLSVPCSADLSFLLQVGALRELAECSWFQRTWVLQELVLARSATVLWGDAEIPWKHIYAANRALTLYWPPRYVEAGITLTRIETFIEIKRKCDSSTIDFLSALRWTHGLHSVDPHDKIYALLGILSESKIETTAQVAKLIEPDYSKEVRLVYEEFALRIAQFGMTGDLIRSVHHGRTLPQWTPESIPSWVPDWARIPRRGRSYEPFITLFSEMGYEDTIAVGTGTKYLAGHSVKFANVEIVSEEAGHSDPIACLNIIADFWRSNMARKLLSARRRAMTRPVAASAVSAPPVSNTSMVDDKCMIARFAEAVTEGSDAFSGGFNRQTSISMLCAILLCIFEDSKTFYDDNPQAYMTARIFLNALTDYCGPPEKSYQHMYRNLLNSYLGLPEKQRLFVMDNNYVGLGPAAMRPGDVVKFLPGTCMPMVLRPQDNFYQLVGGCYVSGLMGISREELVSVCRDFEMEHIEIR